MLLLTEFGYTFACKYLSSFYMISVITLQVYVEDVLASLVILL